MLPATAWRETLLTEQPQMHFTGSLERQRKQKKKKPTSWLAVTGGSKQASSLTEAKNMQLAGAFQTPQFLE